MGDAEVQHRRTRHEARRHRPQELDVCRITTWWKLQPLAEAIAKRAKGGTSLFADDTPLKMLAPGNKKTRTARIRAYVRDERPWSGPCATGAQTDNLSSCAGRAPPCVWYQFTVDRKGEHPVKHLSGYQGWVHADGYGHRLHSDRNRQTQRR